MSKKGQLKHFDRKELLRIMEAEGYTGSSLAPRLGCSSSTVLNWMKGPGKPMRSSLTKLAKVLGVGPDQLSKDFAEPTGGKGTAPYKAGQANGHKALATAVEQARAQAGRDLFDDTTEQEPAVKLAKVLAHLNAAGKLLRG